MGKMFGIFAHNNKKLAEKESKMKNKESLYLRVTM